MASLHKQTNTSGTTWRVKWRQDGKQTSLSFYDQGLAERFKADVEQYGPEEATRVLAVLEAEAKVPTVTEFLTEFIDGLTGIQEATANKYRAYLSRDITPVFGSLPITAVTEHTIGSWVTEMASKKEKGTDGVMRAPSQKTLTNKHSFISGAFKRAVKDGLLAANPCEGRRLPETQPAEKAFLTPQEFQLLRDQLRPQRWKDFATFLILTGLRFSEATALTPDDIDPDTNTCRIWRSWKYTGKHQRVLGPPKTRKSVRTISLPEEAMDVIDLTQPEWLFTNGAGNPVTSQEFYQAWAPARARAKKAGLKKHVRVHDLRHSCASWMVQAGIPLPVVQAHLGHENIHTTINTYFHTDQRQGRIAATAVGNLLRNAAMGPLEIEG